MSSIAEPPASNRAAPPPSVPTGERPPPALAAERPASAPAAERPASAEASGPRGLIEGTGTTVCIVDQGFGHGRGLELVREVQAAGVAVPLIVLVPRSDPMLELEALRGGATDVLSRDDLSSSTLRRSVLRAMARHEATSLSHDGSGTFVLPTSVLRTRLEQAIARRRRTHEPLSLLGVRISLVGGTGGVRAGIDSQGLEGAAVMRAAAERIRGCLRELDTLARHGPERFIILLEGNESDSTTAARIADHLLRALSTPLMVGATEVHPRVSVGIASTPDDGEGLNELMRNVDTALRLAEDVSGSAFHFRSEPLNHNAHRRWRLQRALDNSIDFSEFGIEYQPQVSLDSDEVVGAEALLRWTSREHGSVSPTEFVPLLEASGRIEEVGRWVVRKACEQIAAFRREGITGVKISVNVSARQFAGGDFDAFITDTLQTHRVPPELLGLEITEGVLIDDTPAIQRTLAAIRRLGIRIAVDDFGTGYASLSYIKRFPMDVVKIDKEFVRGLPVNIENVAITSAIVALAQALSLKVVAEGVETEAELEFLRQLRCTAIQGFYFARPMSPEKFAEWLRSRPKPVSPRREALFATPSEGEIKLDFELPGAVEAEVVAETARSPSPQGLGYSSNLQKGVR